jgi:hypothetical protein
VRSSASFRRACSRLSFLFVLLGCGEPPTEVLDLQVRADVETRSLPELAPPFASAEIEAMVETFDWADTEVLPELDEDGRPALYYALVLLRDRSELEELGTHEIHHDALPLFEVEHARWDGQIGTHAFPGSDVGDFAFALIPAEVINLYRRAALDGAPIFRAVILREVPVPEARLPGGSIDYDWLGAQGFVCGGTTAYAGVSRDEAVGAREDELDGVGRSEAALAGRVVRAARRLVRRVINGVRQVASEVRQALGGDRRFGLRLFVHETDADFDLGPDALMRQAWLGDRGAHPSEGRRGLGRERGDDQPRSRLHRSERFRPLPHHEREPNSCASAFEERRRGRDRGPLGQTHHRLSWSSRPQRAGSRRRARAGRGHERARPAHERT